MLDKQEFLRNTSILATHICFGKTKYQLLLLCIQHTTGFVKILAFFFIKGSHYWSFIANASFHAIAIVYLRKYRTHHWNKLGPITCSGKANTFSTKILNDHINPWTIKSCNFVYLKFQLLWNYSRENKQFMT